MKLVNKIKISLLISMFVAVLLNIRAFAATGVVTEITVNVREKASKDSKRIMYVTQDDKVEVLEKDGDWYKIKAKGKTGYILGTYVKVDDSELENSTSSDNNETTVDEKSEEQNNNTENNEKTTEVETKKYLKSKSELKIIPSISSSVIYTTSNDMLIDIIEETGKWTYISADNIFGWVRTDNIFSKEEQKSKESSSTTENETTDTKTEESETKSEVKKTAYIKYDTVNLRKTASTSSKVLAKLKLNDEVTIIEDVDSVWYKVEVDGKTGYISKELLADSKQDKKETETKTETSSSRSGEDVSREEKKDTSSNSEEEKTTNESTSSSTSSSVTGEKVVAYAKEYLGYKYTYGGSTPKSGFDCSGFTSYVYKNFGYSLSRSSSGQANNGTKVSKDDLQIGDILIFKNQSLTKIGHVGIYVGDNKMIHASEPGVGVTITDLDARGYNYNKRFVMARRIIK